MIDLESGTYGTHSLRRTKVVLLYKKTATSAPANDCLDIASWKALSDTSVSRSTGALEMSQQVDL